MVPNPIYMTLAFPPTASRHVNLTVLRGKPTLAPAGPTGPGDPESPLGPRSPLSPCGKSHDVIHVSTSDTVIGRYSIQNIYTYAEKQKKAHWHIALKGKYNNYLSELCLYTLKSDIVSTGMSICNLNLYQCQVTIYIHSCSFTPCNQDILLEIGNIILGRQLHCGWLKITFSPGMPCPSAPSRPRRPGNPISPWIKQQIKLRHSIKHTNKF